MQKRSTQTAPASKQPEPAPAKVATAAVPTTTGLRVMAVRTGPASARLTPPARALLTTGCSLACSGKGREGRPGSMKMAEEATCTCSFPATVLHAAAQAIHGKFTNTASCLAHLCTRQQCGQPRQRLLPAHRHHAVHAHVANELQRQGRRAAAGLSVQLAAAELVASTWHAKRHVGAIRSVTHHTQPSATRHPVRCGAPALCPSWPGR